MLNRVNPYYAFGSTCAGYSYKHDSCDGYRFGFNGQEKINELGEYYNFEYRVQDTRLGRFFSIDLMAKTFPYFSNYAFAVNNPICYFELLGCAPTKSEPLPIIDIYESRNFNLNQKLSYSAYTILRIAREIEKGISWLFPKIHGMIDEIENIIYKNDRDIFTKERRSSSEKRNIKTFQSKSVLYELQMCKKLISEVENSEPSYSCNESGADIIYSNGEYGFNENQIYHGLRGMTDNQTQGMESTSQKLIFTMHTHPGGCGYATPSPADIGKFSTLLSDFSNPDIIGSGERWNGSMYMVDSKETYFIFQITDINKASKLFEGMNEGQVSSIINAFYSQGESLFGSNTHSVETYVSDRISRYFNTDSSGINFYAVKKTK